MVLSGLFPFSTLAGRTTQMTWQRGSLVTSWRRVTTSFSSAARMVMMSLQPDKVPFTTVYLHAMVRDKYGRKCPSHLATL